MHELYDSLYDLDAEHVTQLDGFYTALPDASEATGEGHHADLDASHMLYLFEFYKIVKIGGINSPYECIEWLGIQIPQAILSMLDEKGLRFTFYNNKRVSEEHTLHFYERNPARRGLDFNDYPDDKTDFVRYAVELRCLNPVVDTKRARSRRSKTCRRQ